MTDDGFTETGTIDYAGRGSIKFENIGWDTWRQVRYRG